MLDRTGETYEGKSFATIFVRVYYYLYKPIPNQQALLLLLLIVILLFVIQMLYIFLPGL